MKIADVPIRKIYMYIFNSAIHLVLSQKSRSSLLEKVTYALK